MCRRALSPEAQGVKAIRSLLPQPGGFRVYAKATKRRERLTGSYLAEFEKACEWASIYGPIRTNSPEVPSDVAQRGARQAQNPARRA